MKSLTLLTVFSLLSLVPTAASAFYVESASSDDAGTPVVVTFDTADAVEFRIATAGMPGGDGSEVASIAAAFQAWEDVDCSSISFVQGERVAEPAPRHWMSMSVDDPDFERYILVWWTDDMAQFPSATVGFFDRVHDGAGNLIGGSIILNSRHHDWSTTGEAALLDVQSVMTAMVGRALGLTSTMEGNATYPRYAPGDTSKQTLGDDDIAGITYLYGDGTCTMTGTPEGVCTEAPLEMCPPTVDPGDGGTGPGTRDGGSGDRDTGTAGPTDSGTGADAGTGADGGAGGDDGGGCSVGDLDEDGTPGWLALMLIVGLALLGKSKRR
ncbi:MAG: hypothetical protein JRH11_07100 [Deltaproteobacteria bacterium]|nr:hypothetical protein [Deltaproteobacteria bacterium]